MFVVLNLGIVYEVSIFLLRSRKISCVRRLRQTNNDSHFCYTRVRGGRLAIDLLFKVNMTYWF